MLPDFIVFGAQKAGSTYLLNCLSEHPQIFMPQGEVAFFEDSLYSPERISEFERRFAAARPGQVVGMKRPNLLGHTECPQRIHRHMPEVKLIAILRHPVERAISGYFHYMKTGMLPIVPAEIGLRSILDGEYARYPRAQEVLEFGLYGKHLRNFSQYFPRQCFHIIFLEDMKHDAQGQLVRLYDFLGVASDFHPASFDSRPMKAPYSITRLRLWNALDRPCRRWSADGKYFERRQGLWATPLTALNNFLDNQLWQRFFAAKRPRLSESLQNDLNAYYYDDVESLESWLGRKLDCWQRDVSPGSKKTSQESGAV